jgi:hypothetical protein
VPVENRCGEAESGAANLQKASRNRGFVHPSSIEIAPQKNPA